MTALLLAQQRILAFRFHTPPFDRTKISSARRMIAVMTLALVSISVTGYLVALYSSFEFSFRIQRAQGVYEELKKEVLKDEMLLQKKFDFLSEEQKNIVESMEKVSAIKYLELDGIAASRSIPQP